MRGFGANRWKLSGSLLLAGTLLAGVIAADPALAASGTRFWNLTRNTVNLLQLAPAGSTAYGENLCLADPDKSVDAEERLKVAGVKSGRYDVKLGDTTGRQCTVKNVEVTEGKVFSIQEKQLTGCTQ
ncbi:MAG TPA: hypothetical protein VM639_12920 [Dongiaceae bacterium]|nr:hypothetical protein [Dongiaceae bacterium]